MLNLNMARVGIEFTGTIFGLVVFPAQSIFMVGLTVKTMFGSPDRIINVGLFKFQPIPIKVGWY